MAAVGSCSNSHEDFFRARHRAQRKGRVIMKTLFRLSTRNLWQAGALAVGALIAQPALAVDWSAVPGKQVVLFYPGQSSFEWALTESDHSGAPDIREGDSCADCHDGEQTKIGNLIVSGKKLEPNPIQGKRGAIPATVKIAHDGANLHVRIEWPDSSAPPPPPTMDEEFEVKATFMIDDGTVVAARRTGCWAACHDDMIGMPSAPSGSELTKYLARSRTQVTRAGGGENYKPQGELNQMLADGMFLEFWQARANKGAPAVAADGYILDKRHMNDNPVVNAIASFSGGVWTVELSRALSVDKAGHKDIVPGKTYTVGFAIHDAHADHRFHHVSLEHTLVLDQGSADFVATKR